MHEGIGQAYGLGSFTGGPWDVDGGVSMGRETGDDEGDEAEEYGEE